MKFRHPLVEPDVRFPSPIMAPALISKKKNGRFTFGLKNKVHKKI